MTEGEHPESIIQYSPFNPPKETHGEGEWRVFEKHKEKGYPLKWQWIPKTDLDSPPEAPPEPESPTVEKVPAQRAHVPLKDVNADDQDWTNH